MKTFKIIKTAAQSAPDMRIWGIAQEAYGNSRITQNEFEVIVNILRSSGCWTVASMLKPL